MRTSLRVKLVRCFRYVDDRRSIRVTQLPIQRKVAGGLVGAALTAVMATMVPEAVHLAGSGRRVGLVTLVGFLAAVSFKLLE